MGKMLKPAEVADRLDLSVECLRKWRDCGAGPPFVRFGEHRGAPIRYDETQLLAFIKQNTHGTEQQAS